ncbi:MAG: glycosyltransferase [Candidatus Levybacteria bacterium]|nr:glycosyltransferase [Candidatus Levybacteria bacterium]
MEKPKIHTGRVTKTLLTINIIVALVYFSWWFDPSHVGNPWLFGLLFFGEIYHIAMALLFWYTLWPNGKKEIIPQSNASFSPSVAVFITVTGEPVAIVKNTALTAKKMHYPNHTVYILNDGYVAKKENWQEIEKLADEIGVVCITRKKPGGAKAGNINNAMRQTTSDFIAIFDADMAPFPDFLQKVIPYFNDPKMGFVQTPQYYKNHEKNDITAGSWEQQELFFGPIMKGKDRNNASFICGTNVAIRKSAILEAGGMCETNIAEDFLTSLFIHQNGWKSKYLTEVFATGLAPEDLLSYYKQQLRWARGSLEILFSENPLFKSHLTIGQKLQYLSSSLYYFNGLIVAIDMLMPLAALFYSTTPVSASTTSFALYFVPFMFLNLYTLYVASAGRVTFRAISFSQSSWTLQLKALQAVLLRQKTTFAVTPKQMQGGNFRYLAYPHSIYILIGLFAVGIGIYREGVSASVSANTAWVIFNAVMFLPFINASFKKSSVQ